MVTVVSYASPYVGTQSFRKVFRQLELDGKLRHVRVSNTNDSIRKFKPRNSSNEDVVVVFVSLGFTIFPKSKLSTLVLVDFLMLV